MASYGRPSLPFASPSTLKTLQTLQTLKNLKTLQTLTWHEQAPQGHTSMASYGPLKQSLGMLHPAANRHPKATHQWLLMGVQACRLPALKPLKPPKPLKTLKPLKRCLGMLHPAVNSHPEATHQWLLMGRLNNQQAAPRPHRVNIFLLTWHASGTTRPHSMASSGPLKQSLGMLQQAPRGHTSNPLLLGRLNNPLACFILQPTGTPRPHINGFLWASKPAVCQPLNP